MEGDKDKITENRLRKVVREAFRHLMKNIENEPDLILEGGTQPIDQDKILAEIRSWLFVRREADGDTDNSTNK